MPAKAKKKLAKLKAKATQRAKSVKASVAKARARVKAAVKAKAKGKAGARRLKAAAPKRLTPVPEGFHTITANLTVNNCAEAIEFYKRALGAKEVGRMTAPGSDLVWHCHLTVGDSPLFLADPMPGATKPSSPENPSPVSMFLYVDDCDAAMQRAVDAGMQVVMPMMDTFWGDRMGNAIDPYGNGWAFASRKKRMTEAEVNKAAQAFAAEQASSGGEQPGTALA